MCDYCDFYSIASPHDDPRIKLFIKTIIADAEYLFAACKPQRVPTMYIGGGTPSMLGSEGTQALLQGIFNVINRYAPPPTEVTIEANPESASEAFLDAARKNGVTRLSLGIQSFHDPSRKAVHRVGHEQGSSLLHKSLSLASAYFPNAFSADLISGLPFQSEQILRNDIAALLAYNPAHISLYSLTVEDGTPLAKSSALQSLLPPVDEADHLWLYGRDTLERQGFTQYEVSNFCKPCAESQHNIRYWKMQSWLALGPGASATIIDDDNENAMAEGFRYTIPHDIDASLQMHEGLIEKLDSATLMKESFLMGFRYTEGPDENLFRKRFHRTIGDCIPNTLETWRKRDLLQTDKTALNREGLLFLNAFLRNVFDELEKRHDELMLLELSPFKT